LQVLRPLLPKQRPGEGRAGEEPAALRAFQEAERLLSEDARFLRTPARERSVVF
jgi:hypothetical protein